VKTQKKNKNKETKNKERLVKVIEKLNVHLDKRQIENYLELLQKPKKLIWINFVSGFSRGVGLTLGVGSFGILIGILVLFLATVLLGWLGYLPYVGTLFKGLSKDISGFVQNYYQSHKGG
jgi:hypothetical protein